MSSDYSLYLRRAFKDLQKIKDNAEDLLRALYEKAQRDLIVSAKTHGVESKAFLKALDKWSKTVAASRNDIIYDSFVEAALTADRAFLGIVQASYGAIPVELASLRVDRAQIIRQVRSMLRDPQGQYMNALSKNWWAWGFGHKQGRSRLLAALASNASMGKSAITSGNALFNGNLLKLGGMPKYLKDLEALARQAKRGGLFEFQKALEKARAHIDNHLGRHGIEYAGVSYQGQDLKLVTRGFKNEFVNGLEKFVKTGSEAQLEATIYKYGQKQAIYNGRTLQRSVTNAVFQQRTRERIQESRYVEGGRWVMHPSRNFTDICDDYALNDHDGLGPGIFKPNNIPFYPHYSCACAIEPVLIPNEKFWSMVESGDIELA